MNEDICVDSTIEMRSFTVSSDPYRWAVARVATPLEAQELLMQLPLTIFTDVVQPQDLTSTHGVCEVVERIQATSKNSKQKMAAFVALFCSGLLLAGYGDDDQTTNRKPEIRLDKFCGTAAEKFVTECESILGSKQPRHIRRIFFKLWVCSVEARKTSPSPKMLQDWVRFNLLQKNEKNKKWLPVISHYTEEGLRGISSLLHVKEAHFRHSPRQKILETLRGSEFFPLWTTAFSDWIESKRYADVSKSKEAFIFLQRYWCDHPQLMDPELFFSEYLKRESILGWASKRELTVSDAKKLLVINQFIRAFVATRPFLAIPDEFDDDEIFLRVGYEWPISNSDLSFISEKIGEKEKPSQSNHKSLSEHLLARIAEILTENDMSWPKQRELDWIQLPALEGCPSQKVYCPVLPSMILVLLKLPLRGVQLRRLDSGEGDILMFDKITRKFVPNTGPFAGHWNRQPDVKNKRRGVLREFFDSTVQQKFCGFYINSNKTRDRKVLFDENSGYEIFWEFDEVIDIILKVRDWQETYNKVSGPVAFEDLPPAVFAEPSENVALRKPACFYLFRYPCGNMAVPDAPPTSAVLRMFWYECLAELERRLALEMENPPVLIEKWNGRIPMSSPYHLHGLRLGGLTRLAKAGVSPWILQNIVAGHMNWVMTAYYVQPGFAFITAHLTEHYVEAMKNRQREFAQFLTDATIENIHRMALYKDQQAIIDLQSTRESKSSFMMSTLDNCICPNAQTRCDEGFAIIEWQDRKPSALRRKFGPVPILSTGKRDCARCVFTITGTPFLDGTAVRCNEISLELAASVTRQRSFMQEIDMLENKRIKASKNNEKLNVQDHQSLQSYRLEYKNESDNMVELATSLDANLRQLEDIKALNRRLAKDGDNRYALVFIDEPQFKWGNIHRFEAIDELCRAARWFKSIHVEPLQNERLAMILEIYAREGKPPPLALLTRRESESAIEALTAVIRSRLDRQSVAALVEGYETFQSLGLLTEVDDTIASLTGNPSKDFEYRAVHKQIGPLPSHLRPPLQD